MRKTTGKALLGVLFLLVTTGIVASPVMASAGKHFGELNYLRVKVNYLEPYFWTTDDPPLPGYYIGLPMNYEVELQNVGERPFVRLTVIAIHEYGVSGICENRWWWPYPRYVVYSKGEPLPGDSIQVWEDVYLAPGATLLLTDEYTAPLATIFGILKQTHVIVSHMNEGVPSAAVIYNETETGAFYL